MCMCVKKATGQLTDNNRHGKGCSDRGKGACEWNSHITSKRKEKHKDKAREMSPKNTHEITFFVSFFTIFHYINEPLNL